MAALDVIRMQAQQEKLVRITYVKKKDAETGVYTIEPYEIRGGHLWAWALERDAIRQFLISNIMDAQPLEDSFVPRFPIQI